MDKIIQFESQKEIQGLLGAQDINLKSIEREFKESNAQMLAGRV